LDEDEVDEQVSSLKHSKSAAGTADEEGLGIENGTFKWNEIETKKTNEDKGAKKTNGQSNNADTDVETQSVTPSEMSDHRFELRDISVKFPDGKLTVITGPTASGKTALLVCL